MAANTPQKSPERRRLIDEAGRELLHTPPVLLLLQPAHGIALIAQLRLALRHPKNDGEPARGARRIINALRAEYGPAAQALIDALETQPTTPNEAKP